MNRITITLSRDGMDLTGADVLESMGSLCELVEDRVKHANPLYGVIVMWTAEPLLPGSGISVLHDGKILDVDDGLVSHVRALTEQAFGDSHLWAVEAE